MKSTRKKKRTMEPGYPLSATQAEKLRCKRYFYFAYVDEKQRAMPDIPSVPLVRGRDVHALIEAYQRHLKGKRYQSDWEYMETLLLGYRHGDSAVEEEVRDLARSFAHHTVFDPEYTLIEWPMAVRFDADKREYVNCPYGDDRARLRRRADAVIIRGDDCIVDDAKTHFYIPPVSQLENDPQTDVSAVILLATRRDLPMVTVRYRYLRYECAERMVEVPREQFWPRARRLEALIEQRDACLKAYREGAEVDEAFPASPGDLCALCYYPCPIKQALRERSEVPVPTTPEEAGKLAEFLHLVEAARGQVIDVLKSWCKENGHAAGKDVTYGYKPSARRTYSLAWLLANWKRLRDAGVNFERIAVSGIPDQLKERKRDSDEVTALRHALREEADVTQGTTFGRI